MNLRFCFGRFLASSLQVFAFLPSFLLVLAFLASFLLVLCSFLRVLCKFLASSLLLKFLASSLQVFCIVSGVWRFGRIPEFTTTSDARSFPKSFNMRPERVQKS